MAKVGTLAKPSWLKSALLRLDVMSMVTSSYMNLSTKMPKPKYSSLSVASVLRARARNMRRIILTAMLRPYISIQDHG